MKQDRRSRCCGLGAWALGVTALFAGPAYADESSGPTDHQEAEGAAPACPDKESGAKAEMQKLAVELQNPVADLISVPFQNNTNFNSGPYARAQNVLNVQPVIPIHISKDWNVVSRTILPLKWQPNVAAPAGETFGLGDTTESLFLTQAGDHEFIWGIGPVAYLPTGTSTDLGTGQWGLGPTAVALLQHKPVTVGALASQIWSLFGPSDRPSVNAFYAQAFFTVNLPKGWFATTSPIITANWNTNASNVWTVPVGAGVGRVALVEKQPIDFQLEAYYNVVRPTDGPAWQLRAQLALLFPSH
jgi:hypothetical protein